MVAYNRFRYSLIIHNEKQKKWTTPENTVTCHNALCLSPENFAEALFSVSLGAIVTPRETEDNAWAKFWGDKQRALWYVMVFSGGELMFKECGYI